MASVAITPNADAINGEIHIAAPPDRVFQALTDPKQLMRWFTSPECTAKYWEMDPRVGGRYSYAKQKEAAVVKSANEFQCHGEILELDPPRLLVYSWIAKWHEDTSRRTVVRWELAPEAGGTRVKLIHSGLADEPVARKDYSGGWPGVLESLKHFAEG